MAVANLTILQVSHLRGQTRQNGLLLGPLGALQHKIVKDLPVVAEWFTLVVAEQFA
jgi:hypothetical protein